MGTTSNRTGGHQLTPDEQFTAKTWERAGRRMDRVLKGVPEPTAQLVRDFITTRPSPFTAKAYLAGISVLLAFCRTRRIDPLGITKREAAIFAASVNGKSSNTVRSYVGAVKSFYTTLTTWDVRSDDPFSHVRIPKAEVVNRTPALSETELRRPLGNVASDFDDPRLGFVARRDYTMIYVASRVAQRRIELFRMAWADIDTISEQPRVRSHGKGDTWRPTGLPSDVVSVLGAWRSIVENAIGRAVTTSDSVFPALLRGTNRAHVGHDGHLRPMMPATIGGVISRRMEAAGFVGPRYSTHALRATAATIAHQNGSDIAHIQILLRHARLETTIGYLRDVDSIANKAASSWDLGEECRTALDRPMIPEHTVIDLPEAA